MSCYMRSWVLDSEILASLRVETDSIFKLISGMLEAPKSETQENQLESMPAVNFLLLPIL